MSSSAIIAARIRCALSFWLPNPSAAIQLSCLCCNRGNHPAGGSPESVGLTKTSTPGFFDSDSHTRNFTGWSGGRVFDRPTTSSGANSDASVALRSVVTSDSPACAVAAKTASAINRLRAAYHFSTGIGLSGCVRRRLNGELREPLVESFVRPARAEFRAAAPAAGRRTTRRARRRSSPRGGMVR